MPRPAPEQLELEVVPIESPDKPRPLVSDGLPDGRGDRSPPLPLLWIASRQAVQLRARLPRRRLRRDQPAEGLEDVQDYRRSPPLARYGPDAGCKGRAAIRHGADPL